MTGFEKLFASVRSPSGRRASVAAFLLYLSASMLLYGRGVVLDPSKIYVGVGHDPAAYIWSMVWWPYAVSHSLNPFVCRVIWSPVGFNLTWAAVIPAASFILWPITKWYGPVVSFNVLMILTPAIVSWSAYLLCRRISGHFYASLVGGYLFGFSPYMIGHMLLGQPNLTLIFAVPLCPYLVLKRLEGSISQFKFVAILAALLTLQFLVSTEIVALMTLFGAVALGLAIALLPRDQSVAVRRLIFPIGIAYLVFAALTAPYLYYALLRGIPEQMHPVEKCSADLLGYFVPSPMMGIGGKLFSRFADTLTPHVWYGGKGVYTNPALLAMLILYARKHWSSPAGKVLIVFSIVAVGCSFGPELHVANHSVMAFPWRWVMKMPTLNQALPVRFAMFFFLAVSIIATMLLSDQSVQLPFRVALALLSVLLLLPNRHYLLTVPQEVDTPAFFDTSLLEAYVRPGDTLLIFPFSIQGTSLLWQAQTNLYFNMIGGYVSTWVPGEFRQPVVEMMLRDTPDPDFANQLKPFLKHYRVKGIVVAPEAQPKWRGPISELGIEPKEVGGVLFYQLSPSQLSAW